MIEPWMFYCSVVFNMFLIACWTYTVSRSMNRALHMYEFGRQNGFEQGRLSVGAQRKRKRG